MAALMPAVKADAEAVKVVVEVVKAACLAVVAVLVVTKSVAVWPVVITASSQAAA